MNLLGNIVFAWTWGNLYFVV